MWNVYWAHSYRNEDDDINRHFGGLIEKDSQLEANFDPPSEGVNEAKLEQNLRSCGGMVAILTWRPTGPSQYILYEIALALRARKPLLVFVDDRLPGGVLPERILQRRFSHRTYVRQASDHYHALRIFKGYLERSRPLSYQPGTDQRTCGVVGLAALDKGHRAQVRDFMGTRGYQIVDLGRVDDENPLAFARYEHLASLEIAVRFVDSRTRRSLYWSGALSAAAIPSITITSDPDFSYSDRYPREFQPRLAGVGAAPELNGVLTREFDLYEEHFLEAKGGTIDRYLDIREQAGPSDGRYEPGTRVYYTENIFMGDKNVASGLGSSVISRSHVHDVEFNQQIWKQLEGGTDLNRLAGELQKLVEAMTREATEPEHKLAVGAVAAAEQSARQNEGPNTVEYLRSGGKWALIIAQKIGVELAVAVLQKVIRPA